MRIEIRLSRRRPAGSSNAPNGDRPGRHLLGGSLRPDRLQSGFRRPVIVVQGDALNRSRLATVVCVPLTSNLKWADAPGNVLLRARTTYPQTPSPTSRRSSPSTAACSPSGRVAERRLVRLDAAVPRGRDLHVPQVGIAVRKRGPHARAERGRRISAPRQHEDLAVDLAQRRGVRVSAIRSGVTRGLGRGSTRRDDHHSCREQPHRYVQSKNRAGRTARFPAREPRISDDARAQKRRSRPRTTA